MPVQTQGKGKIFFPDGCKVEIQKPGEAFFDLGCTNSAVTATLNYDENQVELANCGKTQKQIRNMTISGGFTLADLDPEGVEKMGGGMFELVTITDTPTATVDDQVVTSGNWTFNNAINLVMIDGSDTLVSDPATFPTLTSVTGSVDGALTLNDDYILVSDSSSLSGFSIRVIDSSGVTTETQDITVDYSSVTPRDISILYSGSSTEILTAYAMRLTHTDDNNRIRRLDLYSVDANSGGFQFNFKGANEDGIEEMPLVFTANIDSSRTSKRQLMAWSIEEGAE